MKTRNLLSLLAIVIAIAFASTNLFAQDGTKKENKGLDNKGTADTVRTELNYQNQGDTSQARNQVRVNEGQGTMTREQLHGEAKALKGDEKPLKKFVDEDGDGINDNAANSEGDENALKQATKKEGNKFDGNKYGPGDGTGNSGIGTKDGTGYGPGTETGSASGTKRGSRK